MVDTSGTAMLERLIASSYGGQVVTILPTDHSVCDASPHLFNIGMHQTWAINIYKSHKGATKLAAFSYKTTQTIADTLLSDLPPYPLESEPFIRNGSGSNKRGFSRKE